jgi:selenocysteine lyase/cysteine desulfurase
MDKINACLKLCDELNKAIDQAERELASKLFAQLSELAEEMPHGPPDVDDGDMVFTYVLQKLNQSVSNGGNLGTATLFSSSFSYCSWKRLHQASGVKARCRSLDSRAF